MNTVTLAVSARDEVSQRFLRACKGKSRGAVISFASPELIFKVLTRKRWELLKLMTGAGPLAIREIARRLDRDVKAVHTDVHVLLNTGILQTADDGRIVFPFDAVHVDFVLKAA